MPIASVTQRPGRTRHALVDEQGDLYMSQLSEPRISQRRVHMASSGPQSAVEPSTLHRQRTAVLCWLKQATPTVAVAGVLVGLALWGHSTDWTLPKFSAFFGAHVDDDAEWCKAHNVPDAECIECNANLVSPSKDYGWCKEHGVAQCPLHHPDVAQLKKVPAITAEDMQRTSRALALRPRAENNSHCNMYLRRVQFASTEAMSKAGVDIAVVVQRPVIEAIVATGEVVYDQTRTAHLASRVSGTVASVFSKVGDQVHRGDVLALIESADIGRAKTDLLQAITQRRLKKTNADRLLPLVEGGSIPERQYREAEAAFQEADIRVLSAQQYLVNLGLPVSADDFAGLDAKQISHQIQFLGLPGSWRRVSTKAQPHRIFSRSAHRWMASL